MNTIVRAGLLVLACLLGLGGCASIRTVAGSVTGAIGNVAERVTHPFTPASPSQPAPPGLDSYKTQVAQHVVQHNPEHNYSGTLPPLLPAIVVLEITVDREGQLAGIAVQFV